MQKIDNTWESDNQHYRYTLMGGNLLIGRGSAAASTLDGTITVQNWAIGSETPCKRQRSRQHKNYKRHSNRGNKHEGYSPIWHMKSKAFTFRAPDQSTPGQRIEERMEVSL